MSLMRHASSHLILSSSLVYLLCPAGAMSGITSCCSKSLFARPIACVPSNVIAGSEDPGKVTAALPSFDDLTQFPYLDAVSGGSGSDCKRCL